MSLPPTPLNATYPLSLQTDCARHYPASDVYPSHSGPIIPQPQITNPAMVPGGYSASFVYPTDQQTQTHGGIDYSQWVAAYYKGKEQPFSSAYGSAQGWTPRHWQAPTFYPSVQPDLWENAKNEALPRMGGSSNNSNHTTSIRNQASAHRLQPRPTPSTPRTPDSSAMSISFDPTHSTLNTSSCISPDSSTSLTDPSHQPLPSKRASNHTSCDAKSSRRTRARTQVQEGSGGGSHDDINGGVWSGTNVFGRPLRGACTRCKGLKVKCDFPNDAIVCKLCKNGRHRCVVKGRKSRGVFTPPYIPHDANSRPIPIIDEGLQAQDQVQLPAISTSLLALTPHSPSLTTSGGVQLEDPSNLSSEIIGSERRLSERGHPSGNEEKALGSEASGHLAVVGSPQDEEDCEQLQSALDRNIGHPDRQSCINRLMDLTRYDKKLLDTLFIRGVSLDDPTTPIAGGAFADVFTGVYEGQPVAVKRFRGFLLKGDHTKTYRRFYREALVWQQLRHPQVLSLLGVDRDAFDSKSTPSMISPWMEHGTLLEYIGSTQGAPIAHLQLITDIASGLDYLHSHTWAHGDLHGSNVYINGNHRALLGDFGLTATASMAYLAVSTTVNKAGASRWLAPELFHQNDGLPPKKTMSGDVFALGRLCLCIYTRRVPYHDISVDVGVIMRVITHQHPVKPTTEECYGTEVPDAMWKLIMRCWEKDPDARPSITNVNTTLAECNLIVTTHTPTVRRSKGGFLPRS